MAQVTEVSLICLDPMISKFCDYIETKYKDHAILKVYCFAQQGIEMKRLNDENFSRTVTYFEIWNDTSEQPGGNDISIVVTEIIKLHNRITFTLETSVVKEIDSYETIFKLTFYTGNEGTEFNDTDDNKEFYKFIEKFDTVNHIMRD